jgi:hypothetical protein
MYLMKITLKNLFYGSRTSLFPAVLMGYSTDCEKIHDNFVLLYRISSNPHETSVNTAGLFFSAWKKGRHTYILMNWQNCTIIPPFR